MKNFDNGHHFSKAVVCSDSTCMRKGVAPPAPLCVVTRREISLGVDHVHMSGNVVGFVDL